MNRLVHIKLAVLFGVTAVIMLLVRCDNQKKDVDEPPVSSATISPVSGFTTTMFTFNGSISQPGNSNDKQYFRWDWDSDGKWDSEYSSEPVFIHRFYAAGKHQPILEVLNSSGLTDTCHFSLDVQQGQSAPRALFSIDPPAGNRLTQFIFDASPTKDDEDSLNQLLFRWDWEGDKIWDSGFLPVHLVMHSYNQEGSYHPVLEVKDSSGFTSQYQTDLEVNQTNLRLYVHFTWNPASPLQYDTITLDASLSKDLDHPENSLKYYWKIETTEYGPFESPKLACNFSREVRYPVTLRIVDPLGMENQLTREIQVFHQNRPPNPELITSTQLGNLTTNFFLDAGSTADPEDLTSTLKVRWDFEADNHWDTEYQIRKTIYHQYNNPGIYRILVEAMDTEGLSDTTSVFVEVTAGTNETGLVIDRRCNTTEFYPTVKIGSQWWMAKNMSYDPGRFSDKIDTLLSACYNNDDSNCKQTGGLYSIYYASLMNLSDGAVGICPYGWHIPTKREWETLIASLNSSSPSEELQVGGSTDFNAFFPGYATRTFIGMVNGKRQYKWDFAAKGSMAYFWSSTPLKGDNALSHWAATLIKDNRQVSTGYSDNDNFYSVRCIKD